MISESKCVPCQGGIPPLNEKEISKLAKYIDRHWVVKDNQRLSKKFTFSVYADAIEFSNLIAELSEQQGHHPYIHINFKEVEIILFTHKINGLHENDFIMASKIDSIYLKK